MTAGRAAVLPMVALALASAGCFEVDTSELRVRDPGLVALQSPDDRTLLAPGAAGADAVVSEGVYWQVLSRRPYSIHARRGPAGAIELACEACAAAGFPMSGVSAVTLLDDGGRARSVPSARLDLRSDAVTVDYAPCMVRDPDGWCHAQSAGTRLFAPMGDVVEVRRRIEPVRVWGWLLLGMSALTLVAGASIAVSAPALSPGERAAFGGIVLLPVLALGGPGLWTVLTPAREQVWRPPAGGPP